MHADVAELPAAPRADAGAVELDCAADISPTRGKTRLLSLDDVDKRFKAYRQIVETRDALLAERGSNGSAADAITAEGIALLRAMRVDAGVKWLGDTSAPPVEITTINNTIDRGLDRLGRKPWREPIKSVEGSIEPSPAEPASATEEPACAPAPESPVEIARRLTALLGPLSATATPARPKPPPRAEPEPVVPCVGDTEPVAGGAATLVLVDIRPDGAERWSIECPVRGSLGVWAGRDIARARAEQLAADGKLYAHLAEPAVPAGESQ